MKRYFDIPKDRLVVELDLNEDGMNYSVSQVEETLKFTGLVEVNEGEFIKLKKKYSGGYQYE